MVGLKKIAKNTTKTAVVAGASLFFYLGGLCGVQLVSSYFSPRIQSQAQLEQLLKEERVKIDPDNSYGHYDVSAELVDRDEAQAGLLTDGTYKIEIGGYGANESTLRHEVYHIFDNHHKGIFDKSEARKLIDYFFWQEPQATIYGTTGLRF